MLSQIFAIARNTFYESLRQPVTLVVVVAAALLLVMSNPLAAFTMGEDQRMLIDLGLATIFLAGAVLASFLATNVLGREIANRTALTVISKPVSRPHLHARQVFRRPLSPARRLPSPHTGLHACRDAFCPADGSRPHPRARHDLRIRRGGTCCRCSCLVQLLLWHGIHKHGYLCVPTDPARCLCSHAQLRPRL